jgi:DNA replication and repair protein RecF
VHRLAVESLGIRSFRNLRVVDLTPGPRFNVISGDNGQGKTNVLEAIYVVATSKAFRSARTADLLTHGEPTASLRATVAEAGEVRAQSVGMEAGKRHVRIDGKRPPSLIAYAVRTPVVLFHPAEVVLSLGGGAERRRLLDRLIVYLAPGSAGDLESYARAVRERQRALEARGTHASDLSEWEEIVARHGIAVTHARLEAAARIADAAHAAFSRLGAEGSVFSATYRASAPLDASAYRDALRDSRPKDVHRGFASIGPHRDDLVLALGGRLARTHASQGQHRGIVLALKAAEAAVIGAARGVRPILLLDDVSSELDSARTAALFAFLRDQDGQVFLTTTRPDLLDTGPSGGPAGGVERVDFRVRSGLVTPL